MEGYQEIQAQFVAAHAPIDEEVLYHLQRLTAFDRFGDWLCHLANHRRRPEFSPSTRTLGKNQKTLLSSRCKRTWLPFRTIAAARRLNRRESASKKIMRPNVRHERQPQVGEACLWTPLNGRI
jgi:hypothetical protein